MKNMFLNKKIYIIFIMNDKDFVKKYKILFSKYGLFEVSIIIFIIKINQ